MMTQRQWEVEFQESGSGETIVFVPGSFSTGASWRGIATLLADRYRVSDVSRATLPPDFGRNAKIHQCFEFRTGHAITAPGS